MDPTEQRERANVIRTNALRRLNERIDDLAAAVDEEVAERMAEIRQLVARLMQAEHAEIDHNLKEQREAQYDLWKYAALTHRQIASLAGLSMVGRIRWLLTGNLPDVFQETINLHQREPMSPQTGNLPVETSRKLH